MHAEIAKSYSLRDLFLIELYHVGEAIVLCKLLLATVV